MVDHADLRPLERRVLRWREDGVDHEEITRRFQRSPEFIRRVIGFAALPGRSPSSSSHALRPIERRILDWRERGAGYDEIGPRFARSANYVERVESLAHYKLSQR